MKCFYHHDRDAVASCRSCGRGVCPECGAEVSRGLACRGRCEEHAQALIDLNERTLRLAPLTYKRLESNRKSSIQGAAFVIITGGIFLFWGIQNEMNVIIALGTCYTLYGVVSLTRTTRLQKTLPKDSPP